MHSKDVCLKKYDQIISQVEKADQTEQFVETKRTNGWSNLHFDFNSDRKFLTVQQWRNPSNVYHLAVWTLFWRHSTHSPLDLRSQTLFADITSVPSVSSKPLARVIVYSLGLWPGPIWAGPPYRLNGSWKTGFTTNRVVSSERSRFRIWQFQMQTCREIFRKSLYRQSVETKFNMEPYGNSMGIGSFTWYG